MRPARRNAHRSRPGLTLLEMVLSVMVLGLVAATLMSAIGYIVGVEARARRLVAAHELANRLILQYLDDPKSMPDRSRPLEYNEHVYGWDVEIQPVRMDPSGPVRDATAPAALQFLSRFKLVTIVIYEAERGPSGNLILDEPMAVLSRVFDPTAARNPDSIERWDDARVQELIGTLTGAASLDVGTASLSQGMGRNRPTSGRSSGSRRNSR